MRVNCRQPWLVLAGIRSRPQLDCTCRPNTSWQTMQLPALSSILWSDTSDRAAATSPVTIRTACSHG